MTHTVRKSNLKSFFEGAELYRKEGKNKETLDNYGHGTPDDWLEKYIYSHDKIGVSILIINLCALAQWDYPFGLFKCCGSRCCCGCD